MRLKKALCYIVVFAMILSCMSISSFSSALEEEPDYLTFTSDKPFKVNLVKGGACNRTYYLEYSTDKKNWEEWVASDNVYKADAQNDGDKYVIYLRNKTGTVNTGFASDTLPGYYSQFSFTDENGNKENAPEIEASGNIMTLLNYEDVENAQMGNYAFQSLFRYCSTLTKAPELPADNLSMFCYESMFSFCSSLKEAPELPAENLADFCYTYMFYECTSLTKAPELPAKTLKKNCYEYMFLLCSSLKEASAVKAENLEEYCCRGMFRGCESLVKAPDLLAKKLDGYCYNEMFYECKSLVHIPKIKAENLASQCYCEMFAYCTSLAEVPELKVETLSPQCYREMFYGCKHLYIKKVEEEGDAQWVIPKTEEYYPVYLMVSGTLEGSDTVEIPSEAGTYNYYKVCGIYNLKSETSPDGQGKVTFSAGGSDVTEAFEGTSIKVSADEVEGCTAELTGVYGEEKKTVTVKSDSTFTMPGDTVTFTATYYHNNHDFEYSAKDNVLTATCKKETGNCSLEDKKVSITLNVEAENTYDGKAVAASLDKKAWEDAGLSAPEIEYYKGSEKLDSAPMDAGEYTAKITVDGETAEKEFKIGKASGSGTVSIKDWTYGDKPNTPSLSANTNTGASIEYYYAPKGTNYSMSATTDVPSDAGEYVVIAKVAASGNYDEYTTKPCEFKISSKSITVTTKDASKKYGEKDPSFEIEITEGSLVGEDKLSGTLSRAEGENVKEGGYLITYTPEEGKNSNYKITVNNTGKLTINKADNAITEFKCADTDLENAPKPSAKAASGDVTFSFSKSETGEFKSWNETFDGAGTYYVKATSEDTDNYNSKEEVISFEAGAECIYEKEFDIQNGTFNLKLGDKEYGTVTLTKSGTGWAIYSVEEGKYIYWDGLNVTYSNTAYVWSYDNGFYITKSTTSKWCFCKSKSKKKYYLSFDGSALSVTSCAAAILTKEVKNSRHTYIYRDNGDGTHTYCCSACEKEFSTELCEYGENGLCKYCGHLDPSCVSFDALVNVTSKTTKTKGWGRFFNKGSKTTYTAKITASCTGDELEAIEYSTDNVNYKKGMTYSSSSEITTLYIRVTAANGASETFLYQDGKVTQVI